MSCHNAIVVITGRASCFHDYIYVTPTLLLWDLSTLCVVDHFVCSPQAFCLSSAPGVLRILVTSVVLCSLTQATLMSPGQDKTHVRGYIYIYIVLHVQSWKQKKMCPPFMRYEHSVCHGSHVCTVSTRLWVWIPLGPTFYMESKNLGSKWIPYISENSATHPWLTEEINLKH